MFRPAKVYPQIPLHPLLVEKWFAAVIRDDVESIQFLHKKQNISLNVMNNKHETALVLAGEYGHPGLVQWLLEQGADVQPSRPTFPSAVFRAAAKQQKECVQILLQYGAKAGEAICGAVVGGNVEMVGQLLASHKDKQHLESKVFSKTPLLWALSVENMEMTRFLLKKGADVNPTQVVMSPLHLASEQGVDVVELLLKQKASWENKSSHGVLPLHTACKAGKGKIVGKFIHVMGMNNVDMRDEQGKTGLMWGVEHPQIVEFLVRQGADVNAKDVDHNSVLHFAAQEGCVESVELLLQCGARVNGVNLALFPPLSLTSDVGIAKTLIGHRATLSLVSNEGETVLHCAAQRSAEVVELLIKKKCKVNANDKRGCTPLMYAATAEICERLLKAKADLRREDNRKLTALHHAIQRSSEEVVHCLLQHKASVRGALPLAVDNAVITRMLLEHSASVKEKESVVCVAVAAFGTGVNLDVIQVLLEYGADVSDKEMMAGVVRGDGATMQLLMDHFSGFSLVPILHKAVQECEPDVCRVLLQKVPSGVVDVDRIDGEGLRKEQVVSFFRPPLRYNRDGVGSLYYWCLRCAVIWGERETLSPSARVDAREVFGAQ